MLLLSRERVATHILIDLFLHRVILIASTAAKLIAFEGHAAATFALAASAGTEHVSTATSRLAECAIPFACHGALTPLAEALPCQLS